MSLTSKYCHEQWLQYDKSKTSLKVFVNHDPKLSRQFYYTQESSAADLARIGGKWKMSVIPNCDDSNVSVIAYLEVKDSKMLQLFRVQTIVTVQMNYFGYYRTDYEKITRDKNVFEVPQQFIGNREDWKNSKHFEISGEMTIYVKRIFKNKISLKKILDDHFNHSNESSDENNQKQDSKEDFTFIVKGQKFEVNKAQLTQSHEVFKMELDDSPHKEVEITDIEPEVFQTLLYFLNDDRENFESSLKIEKVYDLFEVAKKYQIEILIDFCIAAMFDKLTNKGCVIGTYSFASFYGIEDLKMYCWEIIQYEILKIFHPMEPLPVEKIVDHFKKLESFHKAKKELELKLLEHHNDLFFSVNLDDDRCQLFAKAYTDAVAKENLCLMK